jgi:two-component system, OmpR family, response regulator RegX3
MGAMAVTSTGSTLLVVESEENLRAALVAGLHREGFVVRAASDGRRALADFDVLRPDLVLLDVLLSDMSGLDVCRRLRLRSEVPIIMVSARSSEIDVVVALEVGADDYVSKSCRIQELVARVRAALRRAPRIETPPVDARRELRAGDVVLDRERCEVMAAGRRLDLPRKQFQLLEVLLEHPGRVFSRQTLIQRVWGEDYVGDTKTLDVHVRRLRGKLEDDPSSPRRLLTVRGMGFKFEPTLDDGRLLRVVPGA